jgi:hypothetical protein
MLKQAIGTNKFNQIISFYFNGAATEAVAGIRGHILGIIDRAIANCQASTSPPWG